MADNRTLAALNAFDAEQWRDWLRDGFGQWYSVALDPLEFDPLDPRAEVRRGAFRPFAISPRTTNLASTLALAITSDLRGAVARVANGVGLLLDDWQVAADGARPAAALISLAVILQTSGLARRIEEVLHRPVWADNAGRKILTDAIADAISKRGQRREALGIAKTLKSKGWLGPEVSARLLPSLAKGKLDELARLVMEFCPEMLAGDAPTSTLQALAIEMRMTKEWEPAQDQDPDQPGGEFDRALGLVRDLERRSSSNRMHGLVHVTKPQAVKRVTDATSVIEAKLVGIIKQSVEMGLFRPPRSELKH